MQTPRLRASRPTMNARRAAGFASLSVPSPASSAQAVTNNYPAARAAFNTLILNNSSLFDAVVRPTPIQTSALMARRITRHIIRADKIHPNNNTKAIMAGLVAAARYDQPAPLRRPHAGHALRHLRHGDAALRPAGLSGGCAGIARRLLITQGLDQ